jgi:hypothetical protein
LIHTAFDLRDPAEFQLTPAGSFCLEPTRAVAPARFSDRA